MRAEFLAIEDLTPLDLAAWRELALRAAEPNPFFEPEFVLPTARWLAGGDISLPVVRDTEGWAACLPVRQVWAWRHVPARALVGWRHSYSFLGTPLVRAESLVPALQPLTERALRGRATGPLILEWAGDRAVWGSLGAIADARGRSVRAYERFARASLRRRPAGDYLSRTLTPRRRKELRRLERRLGERMGKPLAVADRAGEPGAVLSFMELEGSGGRGARGRRSDRVKPTGTSSRSCARGSPALAACSSSPSRRAGGPLPCSASSRPATGSSA